MKSSEGFARAPLNIRLASVPGAGHFSVMTTKLRGRFDGKVLVLDQPANLPVNLPLLIEVSPAAPTSGETSPLDGLIGLARQVPATDLPADAAAQHDHYLYGTPKRP